MKRGILIFTIMSLIQLFTTKGAAHIFTLNNEGYVNTEDRGNGSHALTSIDGGSFSFNPTPITYGTTHCAKTNTINDTSTRQDGVRIGNVSNANINYGGNTSTPPSWSDSAMTIQLSVMVEDTGVLSCVYEQGGGTNNVAIYVYGNSFSVQIADATSGSEFIIHLSKINVIPNRIYDIQVAYEHSSLSGEYNRMHMWLDGSYQGYATSPNATSGMSQHAGDIVLGNTSESLKTFNGATVPSSVRSNHLSLWCQYPNTLLTTSDALERFEKIVLPTIVVESDTVANQQALIDTFANQEFTGERCLFRIFQATDAIDYSLVFDNITHRHEDHLTNIDIQFCGDGTLTINNGNGSNLSTISTPDFLQSNILDDSTVTNYTGSVNVIDNVLVLSEDTTVSTEVNKIVTLQPLTITLNGIKSISVIENLSGGIVNVLGINNAKTVNTTFVETNGAINIDDDLVPDPSWTVASGQLQYRGSGTIDLTGWKGLNEVDYEEIGDNTYYTLNGVGIAVYSGTVEQLATEYITFKNEPDIFLYVNGDTAKYLIHGNITNGTESDKLGTPQILATKQARQSWSQVTGIRIDSGVLQLKGGFVQMAGGQPLNLMSASSYFIAELGCIKGGIATDGNYSMMRVQFGGHVNITEGFIAQNCTNAFTATTTTPVLNNYSPRGGQEGILDQNSLQSPTVLKGYNPQDCFSDFGYLNPMGAYLVYGFNPEQAPKSAVHINRTQANGRTELRKKIQYYVTDINKNPIDDAIVYMQNSTQATTRDYSDATYLSLVTGMQVLEDTVYFQSVDFEGKTTIDYLLCFTAINDTENVGTAKSPPLEVLYKTKSLDHHFTDDAFIKSYAYLSVNELDINLAGLEESIDVGITLFENKDVSLSEVEAEQLTIHDNKEKAYCALRKVWKDIPDNSFFPITMLENGLDFGNCKVIIDDSTEGTASLVLSGIDDENQVLTATIYTNGLGFKDEIRTTNEVIGKEYAAKVFDKTQDSSLSETNGNDIRVFNPTTNELIYEGNNYAFLFYSLVVNPVKVYANIDGTWLEKNELIHLETGANVIDLGIAGSIYSLSKAVNENADVTNQIDSTLSSIVEDDGTGNTRLTDKALELSPIADTTQLINDISNILSRLPSNTVELLNKLNITGVLANTTNADQFKADTTALATQSTASNTNAQALVIKALLQSILEPSENGNNRLTQTALEQSPTADTSSLESNLYVLLSRLTAPRSEYLDKLNITGELANTDNASDFKASTSTSSSIYDILSSLVSISSEGYVFKAKALENAPLTDISFLVTLVQTLLSRLTDDRAIALDKLKVDGDLANTANADLFKGSAPIANIAKAMAVKTDAIIENGSVLDMIIQALNEAKKAKNLSA